MYVEAGADASVLDTLNAGADYLMATVDLAPNGSIEGVVAYVGDLEKEADRWARPEDVKQDEERPVFYQRKVIARGVGEPGIGVRTVTAYCCSVVWSGRWMLVEI